MVLEIDLGANGKLLRRERSSDLSQEWNYDLRHSTFALRRVAEVSSPIVHSILCLFVFYRSRRRDPRRELGSQCLRFHTPTSSVLDIYSVRCLVLPPKIKSGEVQRNAAARPVTQLRITLDHMARGSRETGAAPVIERHCLNKG